MSTVKQFFPVNDLCAYMTGDIGIFAFQNIPTGFIECRGYLLNKTTYAALFEAIKYTYGGNSSSFYIPDYRGQFLRDASTGGVNAFFTSNLEYHRHKVQLGFNSDDPDGSSPRGLWDTSNESGRQYELTYYGGNETRPKNINVLFCIKY